MKLIHLWRYKTMIKILFICHGNICRSPMAEFIMKDLLQKRGRSGDFYVASSATSREEIGNPVYPPARGELKKHGISCDGHAARQVTRGDYDEFDWILYMETYNYPRLMRILQADPEGKVRRLLDFTDRPKDIDDPWYTGDFAGVYRQIEEGCQAFLKVLEEHHG